jgi:acyl-CoA oxidase
MYQWLMCYLLEKTELVLQSLSHSGKDSFTARNESQVFHARTLSLAYIEHHCMMLFWKRAQENDDNKDLLPILTKIVTLFGLWCIEKHLGTLYEGISSPTSSLCRIMLIIIS